MLTIGILSGDGSRDDVARQLAPVGTLEWCERSDSLVARAAEGAFDAVVTELRDERDRPIVPAVVALAAGRPTLPVVLYTRIDRSAIADLLATFTLGMRMEVAVRPFERLEPVLRHVLSAAYRPGVAPLLLHHFVPHASATVVAFVVVCILQARIRRDVGELARWSGHAPRTIDRRLAQAGWPTARVVARSFAALDAVWLMTEYGWSAARVQRERGFTHASGVTRLLAAYTGTTPATLAEDGGFAAALEHVTGLMLGG